MKNTVTIQLELSMKNAPRASFRDARHDRRQRIGIARLWFTRMRQVVELARPASPARPEQTFLTLAPSPRR